jgi:hypothetical protein
MNSMAKVVFSRTLQKADWNNARLLKGDLVTEVGRLKTESGRHFKQNFVAEMSNRGILNRHRGSG